MKSTFVSLGTPPVRPSPPFAAFNDEIIKTIEKAICEAWNLLKSSGCIDLVSANETIITNELQKSIVDVMNNGWVNGFIPEIFSIPVRDASVANYSGEKIEKKPDLTMYLNRHMPLSVDKGLFFECKPIGNINTYFGEDGLKRFCDGRYAWAMPHAGMIGYVQRKTCPFTAEEAIKAKVNSGDLLVEDHYGDASVTFHTIRVSVHSRDYTLLNGNKPGPISIRHLWLTP